MCDIIHFELGLDPSAGGGVGHLDYWTIDDLPFVPRVWFQTPHSYVRS